MQYTVALKANAWTTQAVPGKYFSIIDTGAASAIEVRIMRGSTEVESLRTARRGLQASLDEAFTLIMFKSPVDTTIENVVSDGAVKVDSTDGASVLATIVNTPLDVRNNRGDPANPVYTVGMTTSDAPATSFAEPAPVAITGGLTLVLGASATRGSVRFLNQGPNPVALGGAGLTWAKRAVVLDVGDTWVDDVAANLEWRAVCDAGLSTTLAVQGVNK